MSGFLIALCMIVTIPVSWGQEAPPSPAEARIAQAQKALAADSRNYMAYNELALAYARRARETSDTRFYQRAEEVLRRSQELKPGNLEARKVSVWVLLGQHEFARALEHAKELSRLVPDDVLTYGLLADAHVQLGNYTEAEAAVQWMLNLRPGNIPALTRAAYLRELFGDIDGASELMQAALRRTPPSETEDMAWIFTHIAHLHLAAGDVSVADQTVTEALRWFPDYHYALAQQAKLRTAQGRYAEAVELLQRRLQAAPHAENLYDLAEALQRAGRQEEARRAFAAFEQRALREQAAWDNANRELIFYYADHARRPKEALRVARLEAARRKDVYTLDALAWALYSNGEFREAREQMTLALAVGIRDSRLFQHAAAIAHKLGDRASAKKYQRQANELSIATLAEGNRSEATAEGRRASF